MTLDEADVLTIAGSPGVPVRELALALGLSYHSVWRVRRRLGRGLVACEVAYTSCGACGALVCGSARGAIRKYCDACRSDEARATARTWKERNVAGLRAANRRYARRRQEHGGTRRYVRWEAWEDKVVTTHTAAEAAALLERTWYAVHRRQWVLRGVGGD